MGAQNNMGPKNRPQKRGTPKTKMGRRPKTPLWIQLDYEGQGQTSMERPNSISKGRLKTCQEPEHQGRPKHLPYPEATTAGEGSFPHWLCGTARSATLQPRGPCPQGYLHWLNLNLKGVKLTILEDELINVNAHLLKRCQKCEDEGGQHFML